ncbi:ATP-dependent RecD-like DNA helicase [Geothrix sp. PMB-07]|uniref:ATP-dependent DNA helicase n=1 Tax=Geothrix sp. PMB-07 TaxID=3068640 RepID=UPI0027428948|nr:AAA family ATPase [Geothrix sp. PMB-07]WLT30989.1 AAA family ATPase [Geothrix sp. PMB-07]
MAEGRVLSPVGCFGPRPWQELLERAQVLLKELGLEPTLATLAHRVARLAPTPEARHQAFWLLLGVLISESQGHSRVNLEQPDWPAPLAAAMGPWEPLRQALESAELEGLVGTAQKAGRPLIRDGRWLSSQRLRASETRVAEALRTRLQRPAAEGRVAESVLSHPVALNAGQCHAVALALTSPLTLITGRPGTGKTSILVALLRSLQRQAEPLPLDRILLAAPTGKAAQRMGEALRQGWDAIPEPDALDLRLREEGPEPRTLHRALGYHAGTGGFRHHAEHPLPAELVIVDETSMIGLELLEALLAALAPEARLVLLGDADQLPSVEAGAAFRELVASLPQATATLRQSYRMDPRNPKGRHILLQAERIQEPARAAELWGEDGLRRGSVEEAATAGGVWLVEPLPPKGRWMAAFLQSWLQERIWAGAGPAAWRAKVLPPLHHDQQTWAQIDLDRARDLLAHFDGFRLLCPVNEGNDLGGVDPMNRHLHALALEASADRLEWQPRFVAGEPVLVLRNDAQRGLFNGDQGVVLPVKRGRGEPHLEALFPRGSGLVGFPLPSIQDSLDHAYAMTVHKSQGSEFRHLALVLPPAEHPALTREVLYTALTRAKESVLLLGTQEAVQAACARSVARRSGLSGQLG